jgi:hypothetical protein
MLLLFASLFTGNSNDARAAPQGIMRHHACMDDNDNDRVRMCVSHDLDEE